MIVHIHCAFLVYGGKINCLMKLFLQHRTNRRGHHCTFLRCILALEIINHLLESNPLHTFMLVDVVDDSSISY